MRTLWTFVASISVVLVALWAAGGAAPSTQGFAKQIFIRRLPDGSELRILRLDDLEPTKIAAVLGGPMLKSLRKIERYCAQIVPPGNGPPETIWSGFTPAYYDSPKDYSEDCLDATCGNGQFISVFSGGGEMWLRYQDFGPYPESGVINLRASDWSLYAVSTPIDPSTTKVAISFNADDEGTYGDASRNTTARQNKRGRRTQLVFLAGSQEEVIDQYGRNSRRNDRRQQPDRQRFVRHLHRR